MKLNAEELAAKRYITMPWEREDDRRLFEELNAIAIRERDAYAAAITEVAQPLQDRVEELEAFGKKLLTYWDEGHFSRHPFQNDLRELLAKHA